VPVIDPQLLSLGDSTSETRSPDNQQGKVSSVEPDFRILDPELNNPARDDVGHALREIGTANHGPGIELSFWRFKCTDAYVASPVEETPTQINAVLPTPASVDSTGPDVLTASPSAIEGEKCTALIGTTSNVTKIAPNGGIQETDVVSRTDDTNTTSDLPKRPLENAAGTSSTAPKPRDSKRKGAQQAEGRPSKPPKRSKKAVVEKTATEPTKKDDIQLRPKRT